MKTQLKNLIKNWKGTQEELDDKLWAMLENNEVTPEEVDDALHRYATFSFTCPTVATRFSVLKDRENGNTSAFCC